MLYLKEKRPIDKTRLISFLESFKKGELSIEDAVSQLRSLPYQDIGFAKVDHHRAIRKGFPEVIFGQGKTAEQVASISESLLQRSDRLLVTRATSEMFSAVQAIAPDAIHHSTARAIAVDRSQTQERTSGILVACAGTSDMHVACEAIVTAELMGCQVERIFDIGVAGLHRLLDHISTIQKASVIVAIAGMEGALPSVIGGLVQVPVIAVPTSIGYGTSFDGLAPLLAMLNSCSPGIGIVNIDNGFGAGYLASLICKGSPACMPRVDE